MVLRFRGYEFKPHLLATLATCVGLSIFIMLGQWQLERAQQKQGLIDAYGKLSLESPVQIDAQQRSWESYRYRQAAVSGRYDLDRQLLLDNRTHKGQPGYMVLTPLQIAGGKTAVLVNRGWVPLGNSRAQLPALPGTTNEIKLKALIDLPPEKVFRLGPDESGQTWPVVVQALELDRITELLGYTLLPIVLLLDVDDDYGFLREWKPVYGVGPDKHRAYAVQWFSFAIILFGIYMGVNTRRIDQ